MPKRGKRTPRAMAKQIVSAYSFNDRQQAESVNMLSRHTILDKLKVFFDGIQVSVVDYELGEITLDSRGRGSFQT